MSKPAKKTTSKLIEAAMALEEELRRMGGVAKEALRLPLDSERNLERTQEKLAELGTVDDKMQPLVNGLMSAVNELVQEQQAQAAAITERAEEFQRRSELFQQLMVRYAGLGQASQELNNIVKAFANLAKQSDDTSTPAEAPSLDKIQELMALLVENAKELFQAARAEGFEEIARQSDQLRQQFLSARNKLTMVTVPHNQSSMVH